MAFIVLSAPLIRPRIVLQICTWYIHVVLCVRYFSFVHVCACLLTHYKLALNASVFVHENSNDDVIDFVVNLVMS